MRLFLVLILLSLLPCYQSWFNIINPVFDGVAELPRKIRQEAEKKAQAIRQAAIQLENEITRVKAQIKLPNFDNVVAEITRTLTDKINIRPDQLINTIVNALQNAINPKQIIQNILKTMDRQIIQKVKNAIKIEQVYNIIKKSIDFDQLFKFFVQKSKSLFSWQTWVQIKQKLIQIWNKIKQPLLALFQRRKQKCNDWCTSQYNFMCFLVFGCEEKMKKLRTKLMIVAIVVAVIVLCCVISFIYYTISNFFKVIMLILLPFKLILCKLLCKKKKQENNLSQNSLKQAQLQIQPDIFTVERFVKN